MDSAFIIGGTRFIGRHTVEELLQNGYSVTIFTRGRAENPFIDEENVTHIQGDRYERSDLEAAAQQTDPDIVIDSVAYYPNGVELGVDVFEDVSAYVYVSSAAAYREQKIPMREGETPLNPCTPEQATDDAYETYGPRKAEGDRIIFEAAERGVNAMSIRPPVVIGPYDYLNRYDYWIDRVEEYDQVVVPGDGQNLRHQTYVKDVASALRCVAENGQPGEAYNVADHELTTIIDQLEIIADTAQTTVDVICANERELATAGLSPSDFPLYRAYPYVLSTNKLESIGWNATPPTESIGTTVRHHIEFDRDGSEPGPDRATESQVIEFIDQKY